MLASSSPEPAAPALRWRAQPPEPDMSPYTTTDETDLDEPETLPESIVEWQPTHRPLVEAHAGVERGSTATGSAVIGALALGALAVGALAIGTLVVGRLGVGRLSVRRAKLDKLEIGDLIVRRLTVLQHD